MVVAALTGVPYREGSVAGETVSEGDTVPCKLRGESIRLPSRSCRLGEYGGGGEATGSKDAMVRGNRSRSMLKPHTVWPP